MCVCGGGVHGGGQRCVILGRHMFAESLILKNFILSFLILAAD